MIGAASYSSRVGLQIARRYLSSVILPPLPYAYDALAPHISEKTLRFHHDKHHARYVEVTNTLVKGTDLEKEDVVTILRKAYGTNQALFNNAAQSYNHAFYWDCMKPGGGGKPNGKLAALIDASFGSYDKFRAEFANAGVTAFGSGWAWLVWTPEGLKITKTIGADCPLTEKDAVPLLTMDVWEHAYYLDYQNLRPTYIDTFLDKLVNWDFVASQLPGAK
jgi:Fe-Mn family superoxide dismutase